MKRLALRLMLTAGCMAGTLFAQDSSDELGQGRTVENAVLQTKADIGAATEALNELRDGLAEEREPLASRLQELHINVRALRSQAERTRLLRQHGEEELQALVAEVNALEEECRFILTTLSEYRRSLETRAGVAERAQLAEPLAAIDRALDAEGGFEHLPEAAQKLFTLAADRNERRLGGMVFEGAVVDTGGMEHKGCFAILGPLEYFSSDDGRTAGLAVTRLGDTAPSLFDQLPENARQRIAGFVQGREETVPVDASSGDALKLTEARRTFAEHVIKGGLIMIPLLLAGGVAVVLAVWKAVGLCRVRVHADEALVHVVKRLNEDDVNGARNVAQGLKEPVASLLAEGIEHRNAPREHIEEILHEHVLSYVPRLERHLGTLAVLGGVAPLLGLLGTVTGMIHTFQLVTIFGSGDAKLLSGGISEALVTTEFGLAIAIPVLLVHAFLVRRVRSIIATLERTAAGFVNAVKARGSTP